MEVGDQPSPKDGFVHRLASFVSAVALTRNLSEGKVVWSEKLTELLPGRVRDALASARKLHAPLIDDMLAPGAAPGTPKSLRKRSIFVRRFAISLLLSPSSRRSISLDTFSARVCDRGVLPASMSS